MKYLKKIEGFERAPSGLEWQIWKRLHLLLLGGTMLPLFICAITYLLNEIEVTNQRANALEQLCYMMFGVIVLHWTLVLTLAIGCAIVILMKGPAYVADAYLMEEPKQNAINSSLTDKAS